MEDFNNQMNGEFKKEKSLDELIKEQNEIENSELKKIQEPLENMQKIELTGKHDLENVVNKRIYKPGNLIRHEGISLPISALIHSVKQLPPRKHIFRGINNPGLGVFFGPSKSGKTTMVECLMLLQAAGQAEFLEEPMHIPHRRVLFISLEEYFIKRTERNELQVEFVRNNYHVDDGWENNYFVVGENAPRYLLSDEDRSKIEAEIESIEPSIVVIDSLSRLTIDPIEESSIAIKIMKWLRALADKFAITVIVIHHTHKIDDEPLTMAKMAGSRIIGQELDFMLGVNKLSNGNRYLKDVAYRYHPDDQEKVLSFSINDSRFVEPLGFRSEYDLINGTKEEELNPSDETVKQFILTYTKGDSSIIIEHKTLHSELVESEKPERLSGPTLHACLGRLERYKFIKKIKRGEYRLVSDQ